MLVVVVWGNGNGPTWQTLYSRELLVVVAAARGKGDAGFAQKKTPQSV